MANSLSYLGVKRSRTSFSTSEVHPRASKLRPVLPFTTTNLIKNHKCAFYIINGSLFVLFVCECVCVYMLDVCFDCSLVACPVKSVPCSGAFHSCFGDDINDSSHGSTRIRVSYVTTHNRDDDHVAECRPSTCEMDAVQY